MIIEIHALQSFGPSNLNRDDTGNPKEALFGGVRRARISSQSAKRAMRVSDVFADAVQVPLGKRTKSLVSLIVKRLVDANVEEETANQLATEMTEKLYAKIDKNDKTSVLVYIAESEFNYVVDTLLESYQAGEKPDIKDLVKILAKELAGRTSAPDIALFGRMLASKPELNIDAACQMAHALSTHEVNTAEYDYFTAVDDLSPKEESGAAMLGLVPFNSATYYRCARIDWEQLVFNLNGDVDLAARTVTGFMQAFALVVPSGMQNSFVNKHAPDFLMAVLRPRNDGQSLVNAFEQSVRSRNTHGYVQASIEKLTEYWDQVEGAFRLHQPIISVLNPRGYELSSSELIQATQPDLTAWVETIQTHLSVENG